MSALRFDGDDQADVLHCAGLPQIQLPLVSTPFNERTTTPFNDLQYPTDIVLLTVLWRLRYKLGLRDVAELLLQRGYEVTHETVREWAWGGNIPSDEASSNSDRGGWNFLVGQPSAPLSRTQRLGRDR